MNPAGQASTEPDKSPAERPSTAGDASSSRPSRAKRRRLPRFGLRSLFVFAIFFCLFFAWIGRGFYRVRQEDAAIETILRSGGSIYTEGYEGIGGPPGSLSEPSALPIFERGGDLFLRSVGWRKRPAIAKVELRLERASHRAAAEATAALVLLPEVRIVSITGPAFDDASLLVLNRLQRLETLHLDRTAPAADGSTKVVPPPQIESLYVSYTRGDILSGAGEFPRLKKIQLAFVPLAQEDVAALASLPELEELDLENVHLLDEEALTPIAGAKKLRSLEVSSSRPLAADEVRALASLPHLERLLFLMREPDLPLLAGLTELRYLDARFVPEEAGRAFSLEHPECVVRLRGPTLGSVYLLNGERTERPASERSF